MGDVFVGASAATAGNRGNSINDIDASTSVGFGLGNSQKLVGLELSFNTVVSKTLALMELLT